MSVCSIQECSSLTYLDDEVCDWHFISNHPISADLDSLIQFMVNKYPLGIVQANEIEYLFTEKEECFHLYGRILLTYTEAENNLSELTEYGEKTLRWDDAMKKLKRKMSDIPRFLHSNVDEALKIQDEIHHQYLALKHGQFRGDGQGKAWMYRYRCTQRPQIECDGIHPLEPEYLRDLLSKVNTLNGILAVVKITLKSGINDETYVRTSLLRDVDQLRGLPNISREVTRLYVGAVLSGYYWLFH